MLRGLCGALLLLLSGLVEAHKLGESYVFFDVSEDVLAGHIDVTLKDIGRVVPLDSNGDGRVVVDELTADTAAAMDYLQARLVVVHNGVEHRVEMGALTFFDATWTKFGQFHFTVPSLSPVPNEVEVSFRFLFDELVPSHRALVIIENNPRTDTVANERYVSLTLGKDSWRKRLSLVPPPWFNVFVEFIRHGREHIWIGTDHILFLVALLLPSVLARREARWYPQERFSAAGWYVLKVVTLFTLAHSVTLTLAALDVFRLPERLVEAVIALSIAVAALNNIRPIFHFKIWIAVVVFGFFHGFGFANVLEPLQLNRASVVPALAGFNVGVELGQIVIIAVTFPILFWLRRWSYYRPLVLVGGSSALILMAAYWFVRRLGGF